MERYVTIKGGTRAIDARTDSVQTLARASLAASPDTLVSVFCKSPLSPQRRVSFCLSSNSTYHAGRGEGLELLLHPTPSPL